MQYYELTYFLSPTLTESELRGTAHTIDGIVCEQGGEIEKKTEPARRRLGYAIKENQEVFLTTLLFRLDPEKLEGVQQKLKAETALLRFMLLLKTPPKKSVKPVSGDIFAKTPLAKAPLTEEQKAESSSKVELKDINKKIEEILNE